MARRLMPNSVFSQIVIRPAGPSVAMKAKASGTPAKFEATPEKVSSGPRMPFRQAAQDHAAAMAKPIRQPKAAAISESLIEVQ